MPYDRDALRKLCDDFDILHYASQSIPFKKSGSDSYSAKCPMHDDVNASLYITPSKNLWHCFGCNKGGNILTWMMHYEGLTYENAIKKLISLTGKDIRHYRASPSMMFYQNLRDYAQKSNREHAQRKILPESDIDQYIDATPQEWVNEGISPEVMKIFQIRIDPVANRIVYPVRDKDLNLIGFKGRTRYPSFKEMHISKYINYTKIQTSDFFIGMRENRNEILRSKEAIILEGIKSVMKIYGWGYKNGLAAETSCLNEDQIEILIQMHLKRVIIAFDQDVKKKKILSQIQILKKFMDVYLVLDTNHKLQEKMSPCDMGKDVWEYLLRTKQKVR